MMRYPQRQTKLELQNGDLILTTPYDAGLVNDLKANIPLAGRKWQPDTKTWRVAYMYGQDVVDIVKRNLGTSLSIPKQKTQANKPQTTTQFFRLEYIGQARERDDGTISATGFSNGDWSIIFPVDALKNFFNGGTDDRPNEKSSLYAVLGIPRTATDTDIKKAHRISAKTWHPDLNDDPNATEQFRRVQYAYEILSDSQQRRKYDAGLYLQQKSRQAYQDEIFSQHNYCPPKRAGFITVEGQEILGRFLVKHILRWDDIIENGLVMVSFWPKGANKFEVDWV